MSDDKATNDETAGRLRREFAAYYAGMKIIPNQSEWLMADAIDRLAADVAAIKAKADSVTISLSPEDVAHFVECEKAWVTLVEEQRDAAIRERDEARKDVERMQEELDDREQTELVKRLREQNERLLRASLNYIHDRDQYKRERDEARAEVERLKNELYDREQEILSLRADTVERYEPPAAPQPAAPPAGWLTDRERHVLSSLLSERPCDWSLHWADDIQPVFRSIMSRAGSPPVVEVPVIDEWDAPARVEARAYRAALDKAGIPWKEVGRE